jgi:hypothetical protein
VIGWSSWPCRRSPGERRTSAGTARSSGGAGSAQDVVVSWGLRGRGPGVREDAGKGGRARATRRLGRRCAVRGCAGKVRRPGRRGGGDVCDPDAIAPRAVTREGALRLRLEPRHHARGLATGTQLRRARGMGRPELEGSDGDERQEQASHAGMVAGRGRGRIKAMGRAQERYRVGGRLVAKLRSLHVGFLKASRPASRSLFERSTPLPGGSATARRARSRGTRASPATGSPPFGCPPSRPRVIGSW